ncbi:sugar MFS transporter [Melioribacteraceae bacterium 4301-Me]|uniref:MFS transporter n=1 Tax=Pyranulibacter aquaticus TaxID=3163344 RepID=UPI003596E52E
MYNKKLVFAAACIGMLLFGIVLISLGSILPAVITKFSIDEVSAGTLATLLPFGVLGGSLVFGPIVDRYGYKLLLISCSLLVFAGLEIIASAEEFYPLQIAVFIIGLGGGALNGGTNALVSDISEQGRSANLSLLGVFFGIGALGMPAIIGLLTGIYSYDTVISFIAVFILIPLIFFIAVKFPLPKHPQGFPVKNGLALLKEIPLLLLGAILFFQSGVEGLMNNWTTTYLSKHLFVETDKALYALSYFVLGMTITRLALGYLLKKVPSTLVLYISLVISFLAGILMYTVSSYLLVVVSLVLFGIGLAAAFPVYLSYVGELYNEISGTAFSLVLVIALCGNMILNYLTGIVAHNYGIENFIAIVLLSLIFITILLLITLKKISNSLTGQIKLKSNSE